LRRAHDTAALWRDVFAHYRQQITTGDIAPGADLPTITTLANTTGLSKHGARRVLERLRDDGYAQSWHGKGFQVARPRLTFRIHEKSPKFGDQVRAMGFMPSSEILSGRLQRLPSDMARRAKQTGRAKVLRTETLRKVNGRPVALSTDYFVPDHLHGMLDTISDCGSVSRSLMEHGIATYRREGTRITARLPTAHEALLLGIPKGQPIYATLGVNVDESGRTFQISQGVLRADCVIYEA